jgi:hypothetical protein
MLQGDQVFLTLTSGAPSGQVTVIVILVVPETKTAWALSAGPALTVPTS